MKYCIGCVFFDLSPRDEGCMGSTLTGVYGDEEAEMFCRQKHWKQEIGPNVKLFDFQQSMEKAETCPDFCERDMPS